MTDYAQIVQALEALTQGVPYEIANLANTSALLWQEIPDINWVGFYKMEENALILGPFQGKPACIRIEPGRGVCGTAVQKDQTLLVPDVHEFPGHIACDGASRSEIVVPLHKNGAVWGVLDIDSPIVDRFTQADQAGLEQVAGVIEKFLPTLNKDRRGDQPITNLSK